VDEVRLCAVRMDGPPLWSLSHHIQRCQYFSSIVKTKPLDALFVVILRGEEFSLGCGMEDDRLQTQRRGRRAKTLADGIPRIRPWRTSSTRRAISASHCWAASASLAVSKLWINT